jgi:CRP-like cAMP-binding protein
MSADDFALIATSLVDVELGVRTVLEKRYIPVETVYFIDAGMASVVSTGEQQVEVGIIGSEGMTGLSVVLCSLSQVPYDTFMQVAGSGKAISTTKLQAAMNESVSLHRTLLRYANMFLLQVSDTALANVRGSVDERLARWLLMVHDRVGKDMIPLTHAFISIMLGIQRSGVTVALQHLERAGAIQQGRGAICVLRRRRLLEIAGSIYSKTKGDL